MAIKDRSTELLALERAKALGDLYWFSKYVIGWQDMKPHAHRELCDTLQTIDTIHDDRASEALILMPRGSFKSSIGGIAFPIWYLLNNPDARILIASATTELARNTMTTIRTILEHNSYFRQLFGDKIARDSRGKPIKLTLEEMLFAGRSERGRQNREFSISCGAVGKIKTGAHYDLVIFDDVVNHENSSTIEQNSKVRRYYGQTHSQLEPTGAMVIIGTRYKYDDLYGYLLGNNDQKQQIPDRVILEKSIRDDGSYFFPERLNKKFLDEKRLKQGAFMFSCQYQNDPVDEETQIFLEEDFRTVDEAPPGCVRFLLIDPSMGLEKGDYTAFIALAVDHEGNRYIELSQQRKVRPSEMIDWIYDLHKHYEFDRICIEKVGMNTLIDMIQQGYKYGKPIIPVVPVKTSTKVSKESRIRRLEPYFKQHKIYFVGSAHQDLRDQLLRFPAIINDDLVDALAMMADTVYEAQKEAEKKPKRRAFDVASKEIGRRDDNRSHFLKWRY